MDYLWRIKGYSLSYSFIVLVQKWKRKNKKPKNASSGMYVKLVFCLVSQFKRRKKIIPSTMNLRFPILLFCSKENPILVSERCVLMGVLHFWICLENFYLHMLFLVVFLKISVFKIIYSDSAPQRPPGRGPKRWMHICENFIFLAWLQSECKFPKKKKKIWFGLAELAVTLVL